MPQRTIKKLALGQIMKHSFPSLPTPLDTLLHFIRVLILMNIGKKGKYWKEQANFIFVTDHAKVQNDE